MAHLSFYKIFLEVALELSFSKAAKKLYMSQPAVSQSINSLETELGVRLFTRTSKNVQLTTEGKILLEYVESALNLIEMGERKLEATKYLEEGELKIGVGDTISRYYLLPYLEKFHLKYPKIKLQIINRTTYELCSLLKSGHIEIAICNLPIEDPKIEVERCLAIKDIWVCGKEFKKKLKEPIELKELERLPLILLETKANSRRYVEQFMLSKGIKVKPEIELGSHELLLEFAKINLGLACVVDLFSKEYIQKEKVFIVEIKEEVPKRHIGICYLKNMTLSAAAKKFKEHINNKVV